MKRLILASVLLAPGCWIGPSERAEREEWWYAISGGFESTCGLLGSGAAHCWGEIAESPPDRPLDQISAGYQHACGLDDGDVVCWGSAGSDAAVILDEPSGDNFASVSTLANDACAVDFDGAVTCWGITPAVQDTPAGSFSKVVVGEFFACALEQDSKGVTCWGDDTLGETSPPAGQYTDLDLADDHACALDLDSGSLVCWGEATFPLIEDGEYTDLAVGWNYACGLLLDGSVICNNQSDVEDYVSPTSEAFVAIESGHDYVCGVVHDGRAMCWGPNNNQGKLDVPSNPPAE